MTKMVFTNFYIVTIHETYGVRLNLALLKENYVSDPKFLFCVLKGIEPRSVKTSLNDKVVKIKLITHTKFTKC